jgi:cytochrome c-type biogenesis protein CcmH/NrfG
MRSLFALAVLLASATAASAAAPPDSDRLLDRLAHAQSEREARNLEHQLEDLWSRSGSPTADLLLDRSNKALEDDDTATAKEILVKLTAIAPDFAEGWHQRAEVDARTDDFQDAMASLRQALALQPKHFEALAELGSILEDFGDKEHALAAYREAAKLDPFIDGIDDRIRALTRDVEGQGI